MRRHGQGRLSRFQVGLIALAILAIATIAAFSRDIPFTKPYELKAVFDNTTAMGVNTPVRIAGVNVGKVSKVEKADDDSTASVVTIKLNDEALPIKEDAELKIRPRIFFGGNFFVDLKPGSPGAEELDSGDTVPPTQTSAPVQLDQVLGGLRADTRKDLQKLLVGYGEAIAGEPAPGEDDDQDPDTQGETAGKSLNDSLENAPAALRDSAVVNQATLGSELHDLSKLVAGGQKVSAALASRETQLKDLISNFNTTTGALAAEQANLRRTIRLLPQVLDAANPAFDALNASFPPTRAFAREIIPGVRETPATIKASLPWIAQVRKLFSPAELQGLVADLRPATAALSSTSDSLMSLLPQQELLNKCFRDYLLPAGDLKIQDGAFTTNVENYKEFFQALVGLSGESQNFDGNGTYTRFQTGGGANTVSTGPVGAGGPFWANALNPPSGTRPARPARKPPFNRKVACHTNEFPNLNAAKIGGGP